MHIAIARGTARGTGTRGVGQVDEDQARAAAGIAGHGADGDGIVELLVDDDVVRRADGQAVEVAREVLLREGDGGRRVDVEQLIPVEDLDTMRAGLTANDNVVLVATDLAPDGRSGELGQAAEVDERAIRCDLGEGSAVGLGDDDELAAVGRRPAPGRRALTRRGAEVGVADKVVEVNLD